MDPQQLLIIIIAIFCSDFILNQIIEYLNFSYQKTAIPEELRSVYDEDTIRKARDYQRANTGFGFIASSFNFILVLAIIAFGLFGWLYDNLERSIENTTLASLAFFGLLFILSDILNTPFSLYRTFVIEEKFGFNKTTVKTFFLDKIKSYFLTAVIGGLVLVIFFFLVTKLGANFWIWFWIVVSLIMIFINMFYTSLIVPLFNKLKPLEQGELRSCIEAYAKKVNFPLTNIFVIDGSKRSTKANAFFSGIGSKKKIVLFDTLINNHTVKELVAVLAHEAGHFKKKHIVQGLAAAILQTGIMLFILSLLILNPALSQALGSKQLSIPLNLLAFGILFTPLSHVIGIGMNLLIRRNEYAADRFAAETHNGNALQEALKKLSVKNLSNPTPHPAYVFMHYSHPTLIERLRALQRVTQA
jgi:STE24 endopeptidase